ncbi:MAG: leucine-rich repeat domain-containing protein, partial [Candidatus Omnitrophota bacterium]
ENEPYLWEQIGYTTGEFNFYDSNWQNLPTGYYKWAIIAHYDYDNYSEPAFSNVIYKVVNLIPDDNFRMAINEELGQPADYIPTIADLNGLTRTLYANERNILSIEGAQYLTNLQKLDLSDNRISDLSPLAGLINLHELYLDVNQISDLSPLEGMTNLQQLNLYNNQIIDLSPLAGLTDLQNLNFLLNNINDISPLAGLTNLQNLILSCNQISDLNPLAGLTNLQYLYIENNQISNLSSLSGLNNLKVLELSDNQISDLSPLARLTSLQYLWLSWNQISDISPLAETSNLQELRIYYNQISDLSPLAGLTNLQQLDLGYNQISDLSPLAGLTNLRELILLVNQISDLSPLVELTNLQGLDLRDNPISLESMLLSQSWSLLWHSSTYNPLSPCYPDPNRNAVNVSISYDLSWQGNYYYSQDVFYEVWLGISPDSLIYQGFETQMVNVTEHLYSFTPMLEPLTQYYWRLRAIAPSDTIWSGMWSFTTGESYYQPIISVTPTSIYDELTTAETRQREITIANNGTASLIWNSNVVLSRAEQKTGTNAYLTKENNTARELHPKIENTADNNKRYKDMDRDGISIMPEINLSPSFGTIEPNSSVICILNFIPGDTLGTYNYELQLSSNDPVSPLVTVPAEYVVTSPIAYIPDNNFRMAINEALGQPSDYQPTIADLNGLTGALYAQWRYIDSIEGAQYLTNLDSLYLFNNQISDLSPLSVLTNLQGLYLDSNQIYDLSPLVDLTNLQWLDIGYNYISNLSPLEGLTTLIMLDLNGNQISELIPIAELVNLQGLYLNHNQISDLSPIAELTNLKELDLGYNQISDLSPLTGLIYLQVLQLDNNQISDLSPLAGLANLQNLYLNNNQISDLNPLVELTNLQDLYLQQNHISDISPLDGLTNLQLLYLDGNPISYESMLLSQSWSLPWSTTSYNSLSPCYPVPNRNAVNVSTGSDLSWQGNYNDSQDVFYEVWLGISPDSVIYQGFVTQMVNVTEHLYSFVPMLEPLTQYYWRIKAVSSTEEIWSGMW